MLMRLGQRATTLRVDRYRSAPVPCRDMKSVERCRACGADNHVVVCYSADAAFNEPEIEYCFTCGEAIKSETCLAILVATSPALLDRTISDFRSGRLCSSLQPPAGVR